MRFVSVTGWFGVGVGERGVVDRLTHLGLVRVVEQLQVIDAGGVDRGDGAGLHRGMHVAVDAVWGGASHGPPLVFDLDDGQVERGEQQVDDATDQRGVDLIAVAVQRHRRERGDPALLAPQERAPQHRRVRPRRRVRSPA